ncbi:phasin family protein [Sphingomonas sp. Mn802worker]|uniref:phasin family protein n=1 Tax=Sphingomonas sp. Mn802worker TaxID=629773 RepID=UPI000365E6BE|nr:phasin family protein [Sphingomonas sp. Mn802worker]
MADDNANATKNATGAAFEGAQRAGDAIHASGQKIADQSSSLGVAMIDQAQTNAEQAFAAMRAAAQAKDLGDVMRIQGDYLREQSQRSMDQAREIGELIMKFGRDAVAPMQGGGKAG